VIWLPFHRDQDRGLLCRLASRGPVPERLLASAAKRQIDHLLLLQTCSVALGWCGDAPAIG